MSDFDTMSDIDTTPTTDAATPLKPIRPRGFAAMSATRRKEIASKGGKAAHAKGVGHEFTSEEAREAGRKGGKAAHAKRLERAAAKAVDEAPSTADLSQGGE